MGADHDIPLLELDRLRPLAVVTALLLAGGLAVSGVVVGALDLVAPNRIVLAYTNPDRLDAQGSRLGDAIRRMDAEGDERPLGVLIGQSTVREGLDVHVVQDRAEQVRWVNLGASGGNFVQVDFYAQALLHSPHPVEVVVIGAHLAFLAHPSDDVEHPPPPSAGPLRLLDAFGVWRQRRALSHLLRARQGEARRAVARWFDWDYGVLFEPGRHLQFTEDGQVDPDDPFEAPRKYEGDRAEPERVAFLEGLAADYGWFSDAAYEVDSAEAVHLGRLLRALDARGARIVIALLPEQAWVRRDVPLRARQVFDEVLAGADVPTTVLDHRAAMPDDAFFDHVHLNARGRARYSVMLAEALQPVLRAP